MTFVSSILTLYQNWHVPDNRFKTKWPVWMNFWRSQQYQNLKSSAYHTTLIFKSTYVKILIHFILFTDKMWSVLASQRRWNLWYNAGVTGRCHWIINLYNQDFPCIKSKYIEGEGKTHGVMQVLFVDVTEHLLATAMQQMTVNSLFLSWLYFMYSGIPLSLSRMCHFSR